MTTFSSSSPVAVGEDAAGEDQRWISQAMCAETDTADHIWFPPRAASATPAQRICLLCPVRQECLDYALARPELDGVWGGTSAAMRQRVRRSA